MTRCYKAEMLCFCKWSKTKIPAFLLIAHVVQPQQKKKSPWQRFVTNSKRGNKLLYFQWIMHTRAFSKDSYHELTAELMWYWRICVKTTSASFRNALHFGLKKHFLWESLVGLESSTIQGSQPHWRPGQAVIMVKLWWRCWRYGELVLKYNQEKSLKNNFPQKKKKKSITSLSWQFRFNATPLENAEPDSDKYLWVFW